jgi:hypothetical protein
MLVGLGILAAGFLLSALASLFWQIAAIFQTPVRDLVTD